MENSQLKINVLWIEDNPAIDGLTVAELQNRDGVDFGGLPDTILVPAIEFPVDSEKFDYHKYFNLQLLQHPEEIREYISMCLEVEDKRGPKALGNVNHVVPDIVPFDYKLSPNIKINIVSKETGSIKYTPITRKLREYYNPNYKLLYAFKDSLFEGKTLELDKVDEYDNADFIRKINRLLERNLEREKKDSINLQEDDMGLYAGVSITRQFRNHITVGLPVTANKDNIEILTAHAKYFEWLNEYDLGSMFRRSKKGSKKWSDIISEAVQQLRERIKVQVEAGKIQLDLTQMIKLSSGDFPKFGKDEERIFTFTSIYGTRHLPLDGLFIEKDAGEDRDSAIRIWANELIEILVEKAGEKGTELKFYAQALEGVNTLWSAIGSQRAKLRFELSYLTHRKKETELTEEETSQLSFLRAFFLIKETKKGDTIRNSCEFRDFKSFSIITKRFIVFFAVVKLWHLYSLFITAYEDVFKEIDDTFTGLEEKEKNKKKKLEKKKKPRNFGILRQKPSKDELSYFLFPILANPIVMYEHEQNDKPLTKHLDNDLELGNIPDDLDMSGIIKQGEKVFITDFAKRIGFEKSVKDADNKEIINPFYPKWLL